MYFSNVLSKLSNYYVSLIPLTQVLQTKFIFESVFPKKHELKSFNLHVTRPHPQSHTLKSAKSAWPILKIMVIFLHKYIPRGTIKICSTGKQKYLVWAFVQVEIQLQFIDSMKIAYVNTMSGTYI